MKLRHFLISVLALLFVASVQRAVADDNLPRFVIPTVDFTDPGGAVGYAAITASNPYFTIYMWVKNTDKQDTYWSKKPTLTVDGNSVYLEGFTDGTYDWECKVDGVVKYYVHAHSSSFRVGDDDSDSFRNQFPKADDGNNSGDDYYQGLDIYIYDNVPDQTHTVSARGTIHTDEGVSGKDRDKDVVDLDGHTELTSGSTYFIFSEHGSTLEWSAPHTMKLTSPSFADKKWGVYQMILDGKAATDVSSSGTVSTTYDYGSSANYRSSDKIGLEYRYSGKYNNKYQLLFHDYSSEKPITLPYPTKLESSAYNAWDKTVKLSWNIDNINNDNKSGTVYLYRGDEIIYSTDISGAGNYTDNLASYDTDYKYSISLVPNGWPTSTRESQLTATTTVNMSRSFELGDLNVGVNEQKDGYLLTWTATGYTPSTPAYYTIYRKVVTSDSESVTFSETDKLTTVAATANTSYSYVDKAVNSTDTYSYMIRINVQEQDFQSKPTQSSTHINGSSLTSFVATRGTYSDRVVLNWTADVKGQDKMEYVIRRHTIDDTGLSQYTEAGAFSTVVATITDGSTTFTDTQLNCGYYYMYRIDALVNGNQSQFVSRYCDGFARNTATVTGHVTFDNGGNTVGVEGVRVDFDVEDGNNNRQSLWCTTDSCGLLWRQDNVTLSTYFDKCPFSHQMYVHPIGGQNNDACLMDMHGTLRLGLCDETSDGYLVSAKVGSTTYKSSHRIAPDAYTHLTFTYDGNGLGQLMLIGSDGKMTTDTLFTNTAVKWTPESGYEGRVTIFMDGNAQNSVRGYVDEIRFFKRQLSADDVLQNYDRMLGGSETGLVAYWPVDESISTMRIAYDYSSTDGKANENHAIITGGARSTVIPVKEQLSLHAVTDTRGYYALQGLSFTGDGTNYVLTPSKGIHQFNPEKSNVLVSPSTLSNIAPQDFTDKSQFQVSGVVYYENTLYPVEGCRFLVDNVLVTNDEGRAITSDGNGEFTFPVGIGEHRITIEKDGHQFLHEGHWPENGKYDFNEDINGLTFTDVTKAILAGRIVGGSIERSKPLGLGLSTANVGAATLTLRTNADVKDAKALNVVYNSEKGYYENNTQPLDLGTANEDVVNSTASVGGYSGANPDMSVKTITINTDPVTGEFAVKVPPVTYYVTTNVVNNAEVSSIIGSLQMLNAENVLTSDTATAVVGDVESTFSYNTSFVPTYNASPSISVRQTDNELGAFGDLKVAAGEMNDSVDAYHVDANTGKVVYKYGWPIFTKGSIYTFEISSFERYLNYDNSAEHPVVYDQPSSAGTLDINNQMVVGGDSIDNVALDAEGKYLYTFQAQEANIEAPYTQPISVLLHLGDDTARWYWNYSEENQSLQGAVFSAKLTGTSFVTAAPDQLLNIVRDPFGSNSSTTWSLGSSHCVSYTRNITYDFTMGGSITGGAGAGTTSAVGAPGMYTTIKIKGGAANTIGMDLNLELGNNEELTYTSTTTETCSTSTDKRFDGADGDVFIGVSSSLTYGDGSEVKLIYNQQLKDYEIGKKDVIVVGENVTNSFAYSQYYIETQLIPNFKKLREAKLMLVDEDDLKSKQQGYINETDSVIYMTSLLPSDPRFGSSNKDYDVWGNDTAQVVRVVNNRVVCKYGPSYSIFLPKTFKNEEETWDAVQECTSQISLWENILHENEQAKVTAINDPDTWLQQTHSFDAATDDGFNDTYDSSRALGLTLAVEPHIYDKAKLSAEFEGGGVTGNLEGNYELHFKTNRNHHLNISNKKTESYTMTLRDPVIDNYHSVERYEAPDGYGWIYRQVGGCSSQNYEPALYTKYYQPGTKISEGTIQLEVPHIYCAEQTKSNVPAGGPAVFDLELSNATEGNFTTTLTFDLQVATDKWGKDAVCQCNGQPMPDNIYEVYLSPEQPKAYVSLEVYPANNSVVSIDSLHVSFYSAGQWTISDDITLSAYFQPQPEEVTLTANRDLIYTGNDTTLTMTVKGYHMDSKVLNAVRLQQRRDGGSWSTIHSWVNGTPSGSTESALVAEIDTLIDMRNSNTWPDGTYDFRAVTDCTIGGQQVEGYSELVNVIKDITLPKPLYTPTPSDGVLSAGDDISVTFNELISKNLTKDANFIIQGILNTDSVAHEVALQMDGAAKPVATSQSGLTLGNTSFTVCTWLKYSGGAGNILRHGDGNNAFRISIDDSGILTAYITDENGNAQPFKASEALPKDKWLYLGIAYDVVGGTLSAYYASGEETHLIMNALAVGTKAASQGNISLGENLSGAMHELSLYSTALNWSAIQQQMYTGKNNTTPSLIGYWRLDEGHGTKGEDLARSRHMLLGSPNSWYMENENLALALDGNVSAAVPILSMNTDGDDSYLVEMWARISEMKQDTVRLLSLDKGGVLDLCVDKDGSVLLVANGQRLNQTAANYMKLNDGLWHHVALNVLRGSDSQANVIVDSISVLTTASDFVPSLKGTYLYLGCGMQGAIDEVRLWHGANTQSTISERRYTRVDPESAGGLVGYYPMEHSFYDDYHQRVFEFTTANMAQGAIDQSALIAAAADGTPATTTLASTDQTPGLKSAPHMSNLKFDFVTNGEKVTITLNESPAKMEGCTVNTTLRGYCDMNSNYGNPISWSFRVLQNPLHWSDADQDIKADQGSTKEFTVKLTNTGSDYQEWTMTGLPSWLTAWPSSGSVPPHDTQEVTFTVSDSNPIGKYFATVSASTKILQSSSVENNTLDTPLDISLTVSGEKPNWVVESYPDNMTVIGQIRIDDIISTDPEDMVGAFIYDRGQMRCVGKSQPKYNSQYDAYFVTIVVKGSEELNGSLVSFRVYDASTGKTYPLISTTPSVFFNANAHIGSNGAPVIWKNEKKLMQTIPLGSGWNFVSLYLKPDTDDQHLFDNLGNNILEVKVNETTTLKHTDGQWSASYSPINPGQMMKVNMSKADTLYVIGDEVDPAEWEQTLVPGNTTWIGVPTQATMSVTEAFQGIEPVEGDIVSSEDETSIFDGQNWYGELSSIIPGKGYTYYNNSDVSKQLVFPATSLTGLTGYYKPRLGIAANYKYASRMVAVCTVHGDYQETLSDAVIEAYDEYGELRGQSKALLRDSIRVVFISGDNDGEPVVLNARLADGRQFVRMLPQGFQRNGHLGTLRAPFVIDPTTTGIGTLPLVKGMIAVYNLSGLPVYHGPAADFMHKQMLHAEPLIVVETTDDGRPRVYKLK